MLITMFALEAAALVFGLATWYCQSSPYRRCESSPTNDDAARDLLVIIDPFCTEPQPERPSPRHPRAASLLGRAALAMVVGALATFLLGLAS